MAERFASVPDVLDRLRGADYLADSSIAGVVFLADRLEKPVLVEGPIVGAIVFFVLQETLAGYGAVYLIILGSVAIAIAVLAPRGIWGLLSERRRISLFGIDRHLVIGGPAPPPGPSTTEAV